MAGAAGIAALAALGLWQHRALGEELAREPSVRGSRYVGSGACRRCHADNHESWGKSFHRSMTQQARDDTVLGDFGGARVSYGGIEATMISAEGRFEMHFERPLPGGLSESWSAQVVRTVGSRRYQQYLTQVGDTSLRLPLAWDIGAERWMHMNAGFLTADPEGFDASAEAPIARRDYDRHVTRWNDNCIFCHNVHGTPGKQVDGRFESSVEELGIACEACHGPGSAHVELNTNPIRRYALHLSGGVDPSIASPQRMTPQRSAQVCGQCHGQRITPHIDAVLRHGDDYLPGEDLANFSTPLSRDTTLNGKAGAFAARFWPDGTARLTAYEYQGLLQSACARQGELSCTSCHSMHGGDPEGQLRAAADDDALCTDCHRELEDAQEKSRHSRHLPDAEGSRCVNCHMPRIVYGIVGAHRSHRIDSPGRPATPSTQDAGQRPDACALCHLDRTLRWANQQRAKLWPGEARLQAQDIDAPEASADTDAPEASADTDAPGASADTPAAVAPATPRIEVPETMRLLLEGDPVQRAVAADAMGRSMDGRLEAGGARGTRLAQRVGLLLDTMALDPYPAVRSIAGRALDRLLDSAGYPSDERPRFAATDTASGRADYARRLAQWLPDGAVQRPPAPLTGPLRARAQRMAIEIGE